MQKNLSWAWDKNACIGCSWSWGLKHSALTSWYTSYSFSAGMIQSDSWILSRARHHLFVQHFLSRFIEEGKGFLNEEVDGDSLLLVTTEFIGEEAQDGEE